MKDLWQNIIVIIILLFFFALGIFGILRLRNNATTPPALNVALDDTTYTDKNEVPISGETDSGSTVKINNNDIEVDKDGKFSATVTLNNGDNFVVVTSTKNGKEAKSEKKIVKQTGEQGVAGATVTPTPAPTTSYGTNNGLQSDGATENLSTTGPKENFLGTIGLVSILLSLYYYFDSRKLKKT